MKVSLSELEKARKSEAYAKLRKQLEEYGE